MAKQPWFKLFRTSGDVLLMLSQQKAGRVIQAAVQYFLDGTEPEPMKGTEAIAFSRLKEDIDESRESYQAVCRRNKENRTKGKKTSSQPMDNQSMTSGGPLDPKEEAEVEAEAEEETEAESEVNQKERRKEEKRRFGSAAPAAADLRTSEIEEIERRLMTGRATAEDFETFRARFQYRGPDA